MPGPQSVLAAFARRCARARPPSRRLKPRPAALTGSRVRSSRPLERSPRSRRSAARPTKEMCHDPAFPDAARDREGWRARLADAQRPVRAGARAGPPPPVRPDATADGGGVQVVRTEFPADATPCSRRRGRISRPSCSRRSRPGGRNRDRRASTAVRRTCSAPWQTRVFWKVVTAVGVERIDVAREPKVSARHLAMSSRDARRVVTRGRGREPRGGPALRRGPARSSGWRRAVTRSGRSAARSR